jgi:hypothetical protein
MQPNLTLSLARKLALELLSPSQGFHTFHT